MKKQLLKKLCGLAVLIPLSGFGQDANVSLANLSSYYNTYDNSTKMITGIELVIGADGTNSNNYISSDFETSLYLLPCDLSGTATGSTPIIIATYTVFGGSLHQFGTYTFSNQSVDLSQVSGLADGLYRMGAWVNSNSGVANPPDDPSDNAGLLESSGGSPSSSVINFSSANAIKTNQLLVQLESYPNPASESVTFKCSFSFQPKNAEIKIYNMMGAVVKQYTLAGEDKAVLSVADINEGVYYYSVFADGKALAGSKLIVKH